MAKLTPILRWSEFWKLLPDIFSTTAVYSAFSTAAVYPAFSTLGFVPFLW